MNQESKTVSSTLPRVDFYHWVLVNIPASITQIAEGEASQGITPKGKTPGQQSYGLTGINSYTDWFAGDADIWLGIMVVMMAHVRLGMVVLFITITLRFMR